MSADVFKILLVDDKPENLMALEELLKRPDRELMKARSGNEALRILLKHEATVVLLDVEMPGMDGYEVAQLMRSSERTRLIPIIFVTAGDRSDQRTFRGYEVGAVDFLYKPIDPHALESKVDVFIELARKTRALEATTAALRDKVADLETFGHTLSHDLRAPLRTIRSYADVLAESLGGALEGDAALALERVMRGADRMQAMLDELYRLLRLSTQQVVPTELSAEAVLADVIERLRGDIEAARATITHDELPVVHGDRTLLGQILQNLIANSIKYRGTDAPAIHVTALRTDTGWKLSVRDNGAGIPPEDRERVFALFQRATVENGTGVGLTLCKRAVERLGGKIWIEEQDGPGTCFCFTIPDRPRRDPGPAAS